MSVDYEKEYDNRARVPEHPEIFTRWRKESEAYRARQGRAELGLRYGTSERQIIDLFPAADDTGTAPLALFIHGGWWRAFHPRDFSQMAAGANAQDVTVAVAGYDLCPTVSIAAIIEQIRAACLFLWHKRRQRIMAFGHSAGGHLSACMLATRWTMHDQTVPDDLVPIAYSISGLFDLTPIVNISANADFKLDEKSAREVSPLYWDVPPGREIDAVVGGNESTEFLRQSETIAQAWRQDMAITRYEAVPGANHFTAIDPLSDGNSAMTMRVAELARKTAHTPL